MKVILNHVFHVFFTFSNFKLKYSTCKKEKDKNKKRNKKTLSITRAANFGLRNSGKRILVYNTH